MTHAETAALDARLHPIAAAERHLRHLCGAIEWSDETHAKSGEHLTIDTTEARAVLGELATLAKAEAPKPADKRNHPALVAIRWLLSQYGDSACLFGQSKHAISDCPACNAHWTLANLEGNAAQIDAWRRKYPELAPFTAEGLAR